MLVEPQKIVKKQSSLCTKKSKLSSSTFSRKTNSQENVRENSNKARRVLRTIPNYCCGLTQLALVGIQVILGHPFPLKIF
ncbi:hypothetical protein EUGRSUZ_D01229 [Eucalyptus grandis]|uniref:Uncharacterized protein n=2 Tax=Eucalyptus grandis TaxID=71139 RepID=A0A059CEJ4_EUCGR|nr:hypothetical protein EUGRSUZ_D01229 [Eucalyptus grandis]